MVKAFHKAGIEVILDVVFNHTGEGNDRGPTISFRGLDNSSTTTSCRPTSSTTWTTPAAATRSTATTPRPRPDPRLPALLGREMHVDGFRFDLASSFGRDQDGTPMADPPVPGASPRTSVLADTKLIAEAWDAAGLYQVGSSPGRRWAEWNGRYRDDVRRFVKRRRRLVGAVATRIAAAPTCTSRAASLPINSVNFVTCHDGFTLNDLVSYNEKHNEANGEDNRDGTDDNLSWNCGVEGATDDPTCRALRARQSATSRRS